jgi:hypothetical protein
MISAAIKDLSISGRIMTRRLLRGPLFAAGGDIQAAVNIPMPWLLLITADGGGSNGYRRRLWKVELQRLSEELGIRIRVRHFPPGTSKWNKIERRLFAFISSNWRGEPLRDYETSGSSATTTGKDLSVHCRLEQRKYPTGRRVTKAEMETTHPRPANFHGEWNYSIFAGNKSLNCRGNSFTLPQGSYCVAPRVGS